jgi:hypothetical protein
VLSAELMWRRVNVILNFSDKLGTMLEEVAVDCRNNTAASNELRTFKTNRLYFEHAKVAQKFCNTIFNAANLLYDSLNALLG